MKGGSTRTQAVSSSFDTRATGQKGGTQVSREKKVLEPCRTGQKSVTQFFLMPDKAYGPKRRSCRSLRERGRYKRREERTITLSETRRGTPQGGGGIDQGGRGKKRTKSSKTPPQTPLDARKKNCPWKGKLKEMENMSLLDPMNSKNRAPAL